MLSFDGNVKLIFQPMRWHRQSANVAQQ